MKPWWCHDDVWWSHDGAWWNYDEVMISSCWRKLLPVPWSSTSPVCADQFTERESWEPALQQCGKCLAAFAAGKGLNTERRCTEMEVLCSRGLTGTLKTFKPVSQPNTKGSPSFSFCFVRDDNWQTLKASSSKLCLIFCVWTVSWLFNCCIQQRWEDRWKLLSFTRQWSLFSSYCFTIYFHSGRPSVVALHPDMCRIIFFNRALSREQPHCALHNAVS